MNALHTFEKGLGAFLRWFCIVLFAVLVLLVVWQVFVRQVLHAGNPWTEVAARVVFIWQALIGAAYVIGEKDDVAIDFLVRKFPAAVVKAVEVLAHGVVGFFAVWVMVWGGRRLVASTWNDRVELLPISQGVIYLAVPIAGVLILIYTILHIIEALTTTRHRPEPGEADLTDLAEESI